MGISKKLLEKLLDQWNSEVRITNNTNKSLAEFLEKKLNDNEEIIKGVELIERKKYQITKDFESVLKSLDNEIASIRSRCTHPDVKYFGDPAGGSDSFEECQTCGKQAQVILR